MIYRSQFIPKAFGILFIIETIVSLPAVFVHFLIPNETIETLLLMPGTVAEFSFVLWLLIWGINEKKFLPQKTA